MIEPIMNFAAKIHSKLTIDPNVIVERDARYFILSKEIREIVRNDFYYAGMYIGKTRKGKFFPSFNLLALLAQTEGNKIVIDEKSAWLFICGRDIFGKGIKAVSGSRSKGDFTLVLNTSGECLGFGRIVCNLGPKPDNLAVRNVTDVGDFLRRER